MTNLSAAEEVYVLDLLGDLSSAGDVDPPLLRLGAGDEGLVCVGYSLPDDSPVAPRDWPFGVRCRAEAEQGRLGVAEGTVTVRPTKRLHIEPSGRSPRGRWTGRYAFRVQNHGNTSAQVRLTALEHEDGDHLSFALSPAVLELEPGEAATALVKARARQPFLAGDAVEHEFRLSASALDPREVSKGVATASLDSVFEQEPVLTRRGAWVVVLGAVLVALFLVGLAILLGHVSAAS